MDKCSIQLGMPHGTAAGRLAKLVLFKLIQETGKDTCFRCGFKIETARELNLDHKIAWLDAPNAIELYWDLNNIGFSHDKCNKQAARKPNKIQRLGCTAKKPVLKQCIVCTKDLRQDNKSGRCSGHRLRHPAKLQSPGQTIAALEIRER
jgi:hypothetical protein